MFTWAFTLNCTSTGSPATTVVWTKDSQVLSRVEDFVATQILRDGVNATYDNLLTIHSGPTNLTGVYDCTVINSVGSSTRTTSILGKHCKLSSLLWLKMYLSTLNVYVGCFNQRLHCSIVIVILLKILQALRSLEMIVH